MIQIDEAKCDGCGLCIPGCPEGALALVNGKARLVRESFCDGLGACLGNCPAGALRVVEVEADAYDAAGVIAHLQQTAPELVDRHQTHLRAHGMAAMPEIIPVESLQPSRPAALPAYPSVQMRAWAPEDEIAKSELPRMRSELRQWPVQLHLVPPTAPYFQGADLVLVADCVPFAYPNFHQDFLKGNAVAVGCPKLDDARAYVDKVTEILTRSDVRSLKVVYMEVPCCRGLVFVAERALAASSKKIPFESVMIEIDG
jgi:NAD-dependent dihydropyrimidine dehydrogenase PreA subunit